MPSDTLKTSRSKSIANFTFSVVNLSKSNFSTVIVMVAIGMRDRFFIAKRPSPETSTTSNSDYFSFAFRSMDIISGSATVAVPESQTVIAN